MLRFRDVQAQPHFRAPARFLAAILDRSLRLEDADSSLVLLKLRRTAILAMAPHPLPSAPSHELKSHNASTYNAIAPQYNTWTVWHDPTRLHYLTLLLPRLPSTSTCILELGAGAGDPGTALLATLPEARIIANDISSVQMSLLQARLAAEISAGKVETRQGDMMDLDFDEGELDAVVGLYTIIHLPREEQGELVRRLGKWVRGGGWLLVNFAGKESEGTVEVGWLEEGKESQNVMYWSSWSTGESRRLVEEAGFRIEIAEIGGPEDFFWVLAQKVE